MKPLNHLLTLKKKAFFLYCCDFPKNTKMENIRQINASNEILPKNGQKNSFDKITTRTSDTKRAFLKWYKVHVNVLHFVPKRRGRVISFFHYYYLWIESRKSLSMLCLLSLIENEWLEPEMNDGCASGGWKHHENIHLAPSSELDLVYI